MEELLETLKRHIAEHPPNFGDGESVLSLLYECHNENNPYDNHDNFSPLSGIPEYTPFTPHTRFV